MSIAINRLIPESRTGQQDKPLLIQQDKNAAVQLIHSIFESSTDAVVGIDAHGYVRYWNQRFEQLSGFSAHTLHGKHCSDLFSNGNRQCPPDCKSQCSINQSHSTASQRTEFNASISLAKDQELLVNIGSCYIPQKNPQTATTYFSIRKSLINNIPARQQEAPADMGLHHLDQLTRRQQKILGLAVEGMSTSQIAQHLSISLETVRNHFKHIYPKLGVHSRAEAVGLVLRARQV